MKLAACIALMASAAPAQACPRPTRISPRVLAASDERLLTGPDVASSIDVNQRWKAAT